MEHKENCNLIKLEGTVCSELAFSHELYDEKFNVFTLSVQRLSDKTDDIQVTIAEKSLNGQILTLGQKIIVQGQLRSYNKMEGGRNKLILTVFARSLGEVAEGTPDPNHIELEGYVCKKPVFRTTPFGREIADLLVAVNRAYKKSDYIPAIAWGRNARFAEHLNVGDKIRLEGRFQSRQYQKCFGTNEREICTAYEVSIGRLEHLEKSDEDTAMDCEETMSSMA
ncbi:single-stranded DNA-binding protein [Proteiniclasticum sp. QWL-01]|uniref:single-stranded DNA-binding protein n=1 Tax=Proteiniclasticum sp. QWL-01 TaxID=3036945 RepID=UPI00240F682A|nr:single-stranded DNA-binding protein [Proteiniclasticum sp. QWL-01]WFF71541.1 single-stranded DNA-binding protein [Proteiniclasticum sp. QWL-01]